MLCFMGEHFENSKENCVFQRRYVYIFERVSFDDGFENLSSPKR